MIPPSGMPLAPRPKSRAAEGPGPTHVPDERPRVRPSMNGWASSLGCSYCASALL